MKLFLYTLPKLIVKTSCGKMFELFKVCIVNRLKNPFNCLAFMWFLCALRCFFDLDMLRATPSNVGTHQYGRRSPNPHATNTTDSEEQLTYHFTLQDFNYNNNVIDVVFNMLYSTIMFVFGTYIKAYMPS